MLSGTVRVDDERWLVVRDLFDVLLLRLFYEYIIGLLKLLGLKVIEDTFDVALELPGLFDVESFNIKLEFFPILLILIDDFPDPSEVLVR